MQQLVGQKSSGAALINAGTLIAAIIGSSIVITVSLAAPSVDHNNRKPHSADLELIEKFAYYESHTPEEWTEKFQCRKNETKGALQVLMTNVWERTMEPECHRDSHSWRFKYVDELRTPGSVFIRDATMDERLANIIQTISLQNMFDTSFSYFNSGDQQRDAYNELAVAGPEVDDAKCARDLARMSQLFDDLQTRLREQRLSKSILSSSRQDNLKMLEVSHIQLARVLDSFGRYESGALEGKTRLVGAYDECESGRLSVADAAEPMHMRYCVANLNTGRHVHATLRHRERFSHETAPGLLSSGVCLPRSCHSKNLHRREHKQIVQKLVDSQLNWPTSIYVEPIQEIDSIFCLVDPESEYGRIPLSGCVCLLFIGLWVLLSVVATLINRFTTGQPGKGKQVNTGMGKFSLRVLRNFDLVQSWRGFTSDKRHVDLSDPLDLDMLNPIKLFCSLWCIITHMSFMLASLATGQVRIAALVDLDPGFQVALLTYTITDTFFVVSGLIITYVVLVKLNKVLQRRAAAACSSLPSTLSGSNKPLGARKAGASGPWNFMNLWLGLAANRYLRIVPLYAIFFWFRRDVLTYLGSGPLWDHGLNKETPSGSCAEEPWWVPFTFWSAFLPISRQCFVPSWSISNDIFFGLLIPPVIIMYTNRPRWTVSSVVVLILLTNLATFGATVSSTPGPLWEMLEARMTGIVLIFTSLSHLYTWPFFRAPSYLIGSLGGYCLFRYSSRVREQQRQQQKQQNKDDPSSFRQMMGGNSPSSLASQWPNWFKSWATRACWSYLALHLIISLTTNQSRRLIEPYHRLATIYWIALDHSVWSLANVIIFMRLVTDWRHKTFVRAFASQTCRTLGKLVFPIMFVHWIFIIVFLNLLPTPASFTLWQICAAAAAVIGASVPVATLVHLLFESPIDKLIKKEILKINSE